jgi:hypothetical protein
VAVGPGISTVVGDATLLRLGLRALVDHARGPAGAGTPAPVDMKATFEGGRLRVTVSTPGPTSATGAGLGFARRVAELHGSSLTVDGEGSGRYSITLTPA